jgi:predicted RNA binding protein YcfA (HicA-like mRNA interferase family)
MSKLPIVDARTFERILLKWGFVVVRQKGSHVFYAIPMGAIPRCRITKARISVAR